MARIGQGGRSSRPVAITEADRKRLRVLDRKIGRLKYATWINWHINPSLAAKQREALRDLDYERMRLRGYGNAIVPQVAAEFIRAAI